MTEKDIQKVLINEYLLHRQKYSLLIPNIYYFKWESDLLGVNMMNDNIVEFEIKCSRFDYLQDFKKADKHKALEERRDFSQIPNEFYYVTTEEIASGIEVPDYAGLICVFKQGLTKYTKILKRAPRLHNEHMEESKWRDIAIKLNHRLIS